MKHLLSATTVLFALFALLQLGSTQMRTAAPDLSGATQSSNARRRKLHD
jgi:hypothetical protein